ncbi:prepilin-type N-terminal cleavage/methylation domain-containing protein [Agaribacter marinus]|uniref:Type II secretion system protein n=1 Tax=Virgibacillus salarius TaxID=447199 RepID=A0A941DY25_9BACI|nr:competence type IV pilus minor pilin ComGD [uncultured Virgibacillus sp.]MBR7797796.1 type II secretion system protein [Virgibacillus salarius]NAZ10506.1 prepilin-type N-terminal cleavage/methylation domain-containing protein [Agaribacter marinus]
MSRLHDTKGFTLTEMLVVLSMLMIMVGLSVPPIVYALEKMKENALFQTLESDIMTIQHMSSLTTNRIQLILNENKYYVLRSNRKIIPDRNLPEGWHIDYFINPIIEFDINGSIKNPRTFYIYSPTARYKIVFPFGKGRYRIEKNERIYSN